METCLQYNIISQRCKNINCSFPKKNWLPPSFRFRTEIYIFSKTDMKPRWTFFLL